MQRSLFHSLFAAGALVALFSLHACRKDVDLKPNIATDGVATDRNQIFYGVTIWGNAFKPSKLVEIDQNTGGAVVGPQMFFNPAGNPINVTDVRGICYMGGGKYVITTGTNNAIGVPVNSLFDLDVTTGEVFFLSASNVGTVSDIDFDPISQTIYGLNGNNLIAITGGGFNVYASTPLVGLAAGYVAKGLSMVGDFNVGLTIDIAATRNGAAGTAFMYTTTPAGAATFLSALAPVGDLQGGNCGLSYQLQPNSVMFINRSNASLISGLNVFPWPNANPNIVTALWGATGFFFDDLSSDVGL